MMTRLLFASVVAAALAAPACAGEDPGTAVPDKPKPKNTIRFDKEKKTVEIDGKICLAEGQLELFACAEGGKEYESLVSLQGEPWQMHVSLLLLGLKPGGEGGPKFQGDPTVPKGDPLIIEVQWKENDKVVRKRAEDLMFDTKRNEPMAHIEWIFAGSKFVKDENGKDIYAANLDKSIVTVFHDPLSVIDNPLDTGGDDTVYIVNQKAVPPKDTPVTLIISPGKAKKEGDAKEKPEPEKKEPEKKEEKQP